MPTEQQEQFLPCVCGHAKGSHYEKALVCWLCLEEVESILDKKFSHNFKLDNLKYIEMIQTQKDIKRYYSNF